ncbi:uncharacterized protein LOC8073311 [Sorghum bicolor]|uniref:LTI65/LTI78 PGEED repeat domain-containing protein n=1 Tax=Sorghum bicolor TaxID=4558 RepID=A0A1B6Q1V5_SORBI|nr:uncharacterized protein LOC8073311 [Sorghum bicolor]KXG31903.1 hypothetical protein SORBI_3003G074300 [Sorghum bicolor]|eukprot:XP_002455207.2 uncharacterized protein LOC8073311 [Sorghum bicolor]
MSEIRKLKRGISTKPVDHLVHNGQHPFYEWEEQQRHWPSPRAPPASPTESPMTPGGSQKKAVLGRVKSKAKKWMHMLHHKKKPAQEEMMWTPRAGPGPSVEDNRAKEERRHAEYRGTPRKLQQHASFSGDSERASEVFLEASPRHNTPVPSPTAHQEQPYFKVSSRFESEMKEANEMLMESKKLRVNTSKPKTVTFAPTIERELGNEKSGWKDRELPEPASQVFRNAFATVYQMVLKMIAKIHEAMVAYNIDRRHMLEKLISVNRYLMLKLEPGEDDTLLSEVITDAILNLFDTWSESVERPLVRRAKEISSWFLQERREETPPVPPSTHPCAIEDAEVFYSLENEQ